MKRIALVLLCIASLISARGDELRIARFDAKRVFDQYQHTKDLEAEISIKRHTRLSENESNRIESHLKLKARVVDLSGQVRAATASTPERDRLEQQLQIATLELQLDELRLIIEALRREKTIQDESQQMRAGIIAEIWAEARELATESGYSFCIADGLASDGPFLSIIVTARYDDITDSLLTRLNKQYSVKTPK